MNRIDRVFNQPNHKALIAYVTVGYPSHQATLEVVPRLADWGCDIIELGIPFSDPIADGTTIQEASYRALQQGITPKLCLEIASKLRQQVTVPLIFLTYYNPVYRFGLESFCQALASAGVDGLIIPDLPPEEGTELEQATQEQQLDLIYLLSPTSSDERTDLIAGHSRGFIYLVSLTGVTGARDSLPAELEEFVLRVRKRTHQPLCVGFGIASAEQASRVAKIADGIIVGSRIVQLMNEPSLVNLEQFIKGLSAAI
jgi:tryptophan synthase alpha chain